MIQCYIIRTTDVNVEIIACILWFRRKGQFFGKWCCLSSWTCVKFWMVTEIEMFESANTKALWMVVWGGADKSLAQPGRKQATATKIGVYSTYTPWSSVHLHTIQSMPSLPTSWSFTLILFSKLCVGLPSGLLPPGLPTKTLYAHLLSRIHDTCPALLILLDLITWIIFGEKYGA